MDLRDRSRCQRLGINPREDVSELLADDWLDLGKRSRRDLVDEPSELFGVDVGQQVGA